MYILFLSEWYPYPPDNGSKLRIYSLIRGLAKFHEVTLLSFMDSTDTRADISSLAKYCREIYSVPWKRFEPNSKKARLGYFRSTPRSVIDTYSPEMEQKVKHLLNNKGYDLIIASQSIMAGYANYYCGLPAIFEEIEVGVYFQRYAQAKNPWHRFRHELTWIKYRNYLARLLKLFRACTVVSENELLLLQKAVRPIQTIEVIPNSIYLDDYQNIYGTPQPNTLIYAGSFKYFANYDAMQWFLKEIFPLIQSKIGDVNLTITGDNVGLPLPTSKNVILTGYVTDVRSLIASAWVSITPLRIGGGTRLKILESMALHTPVVTTSKGAEGLDVQDEVHLLIANNPADYSEAVIRLLKDQELRERLVDNAFQLLRKRYDWAVVMPLFLNLVERSARA